MEASGVIDQLRTWAPAWLLVLFAGILWWAFRPKNRRRFRGDADIPLRDEDETSRH